IEEAAAAAAAVGVADLPVIGETKVEATASAASVAVEEKPAEAEGKAQAGWAEVPMDTAATDGATDASPEVAMAAIQAAFEAAALTNGDVDDEIAVIDDDALAARLNGLVPAHDAEQPKKASSSKETVNSQVVVVGLVSVASIASFKRHLGRISGVQSVGVSS